MKTLILLFLLGFVACVSASVDIMIDIVTDHRGVNYILNGQSMSSEKLKEFVTAAADAGPDDPFVLRPDSGTSFESVYKTLQLLKAAGARRMEIMAGEDAGGGPDKVNNLWLSIRALDLKTAPNIPPPEK